MAAQRKKMAGFLGLALLALAIACPRPAMAKCGGGAPSQVTIAAIGERFEIVLEDKRVIRLAGLDLPLAEEGDVRTTAAASALLTQKLVGQNAQLTLYGAKPDRWGRLPGDIEAAPEGAAPVSTAKAMLEAGYARVRPEFETKDCAGERLPLEAAARAAGRGLWTDSAYRVIEAGELEDLRRRDGQFTLVEGTVVKVGQGASRIYLDFARRGGFTALALRSKSAEFAKAGIALGDLTGVRVRVRGALDNRFGLRMDLIDPSEIERLDGGAQERGK